jgi:hypothetical protein
MEGKVRWLILPSDREIQTSNEPSRTPPIYERRKFRSRWLSRYWNFLSVCADSRSPERIRMIA